MFNMTKLSFLTLSGVQQLRGRKIIMFNKLKISLLMASLFGVSPFFSPAHAVVINNTTDAPLNVRYRIIRQNPAQEDVHFFIECGAGVSPQEKSPLTLSKAHLACFMREDLPVDTQYKWLLFINASSEKDAPSSESAWMSVKFILAHYKNGNIVIGSDKSI